MANRNWSNGGKLYSMHTMPVLITCNFIVDVANGNGLGIRSLKGPGVKAVYMHTSATKAAGSPGDPTTGPASGTIVVQLQDNYNRLLGGMYSIVSPVGTPIKVDNSALTPGVAYVITTVGNSTAAQMHSIGLADGVAPAVGAVFLANAVGITGEANTSTTRVAPVAANGSEILTIETVGDANQSIAPDPNANQGFGAQIILQTRNDSSADHSAIVTPADNSVIQLSFLLSNSSVQVAGE